jgi:hypothetical protein
MTTVESVRRSVGAVRCHLKEAAREVLWQVEHQAWTVLGYASWDEMREAEYGGIAVIVPSAERPQLTAALRSNGLTQKSIAQTLGVTDRTVRHDLEAEKFPHPGGRVTKPTRPGVNRWSRRVQNVSLQVPIDELTEDEVEELLGAATFLADYCRGSLIARRKNDGR